MIIYVPGFPRLEPNRYKGNGTDRMIEIVLGIPVCRFDYDVTAPVRSLEQMVVRLKEIRKTDKDILVMGSSLGGFMASQLIAAADSGIKMVLFNPSFKPMDTLGRYIGQRVSNDQIFLEEYAEEYNELPSIEVCLKEITSKGSGGLIVTTDDDVIDHKNITYPILDNFHFFDKLKLLNLHGHRLDEEKLISIGDDIKDYYYYLKLQEREVGAFIKHKNIF